jgi:hypothetical protein
MRTTIPALFALASLSLGCGAIDSSEQTARDALDVSAGGVRTLRVDATLDVRQDFTFMDLDLGGDNGSGSFAVELTPTFLGGEDIELRVVITNIGTGEVFTRELSRLPGAGATVGGITLFPCEDRCSSELIVTVESDSDVEMDVAVHARHDAQVLGDDALMMEVFAEDGAAFGAGAPAVDEES